MTTYYTVEAAFTYTATETDDPILSEWLDDVMVHLEELGADDVMMVSDDTESTFVISLLVEGQSGDMPEQIVGKGMSSLRTAFHACDATTSSWPSPREALLLYVNLTAAGSTEEAHPTEAQELVPA